MKATLEQNIEAAKTANRKEWVRRKSIEGGILAAFTLGVVFLLPRYIPSPYDGMVAAFGAAIGLTAAFLLNRESFRSRRGSLVPAWCLVAAMWGMAAVTTVLTWMG